MDKLLGDIRPVGVRGVDEIDVKLSQGLSVRVASALSRGGPQTRGAAMRIAPKPRRWISMSPPILNEPDLRASSFTIVRIPSALAQFGVGAPGRAEIRSATRCWSRHKLRSWIPRASRMRDRVVERGGARAQWPQASAQNVGCLFKCALAGVGDCPFSVRVRRRGHAEGAIHRC